MNTQSLPKSAASEPENMGMPKGFRPSDIGLPDSPTLGPRPGRAVKAAPLPKAIKMPMAPAGRVKSSMPHFRGTPSSMPGSTFSGAQSIKIPKGRSNGYGK